MKENFQFLTFLTLYSLFALENLPLLTFWVVNIPIIKYKRQLACVGFQLNLWRNMYEELFKSEYLIKLSQYFRNLEKAVMGFYIKAFFCRASKVLADFDEVFHFEKFLIYVLSKL